MNENNDSANPVPSKVEPSKSSGNHPSEDPSRDPDYDRLVSVESDLKHQMIHVLLFLVLAIVTFLVLRTFVFHSVKVEGSSMAPTFRNGDYLLLDKFTYNLKSPDSGDIVVLDDPGNEGYAVKRIIAKPGDTLRIKDGKVYLNGKRLNETYLINGIPTRAFGGEDQFYIFGKDRYFVLGDNRTNSVDSRAYGPVPREKIRGHVKQ